MPGIAGIISRQPSDECQKLLGEMLKSMYSEDFYTTGSCFAPEMGAYCGWIAHEESFAARQSAHGLVDSTSLVFSGECFTSQLSSNARDMSNGGVIASELLEAYQSEGDDFVPKLNGLFSGVLIDRKRNCALLFNDRYGVERIYFHESNGDFYFASEAKALLRVLPELRQFDDEGVADFLTFGCTLDNRTLFRNIRCLPGGSLWTIRGAACVEKRQYFSPQEWESQSTLTENAFEEELVETFRRILPPYFLSDARSSEFPSLAVSIRA